MGCCWLLLAGRRVDGGLPAGVGARRAGRLPGLSGWPVVLLAVFSAACLDGLGRLSAGCSSAGRLLTAAALTGVGPGTSRSSSRWRARHDSAGPRSAQRWPGGRVLRAACWLRSAHVEQMGFDRHSIAIPIPSARGAIGRIMVDHNHTGGRVRKKCTLPDSFHGPLDSNSSTQPTRPSARLNARVFMALPRTLIGHR